MRKHIRNRIAGIFSGICILFAYSCKHLLDTVPTDFSTPQQYYNTESQLNDALAGVYTTLSNKYLYSNEYLNLLTSGNDEGWYRSSSIVGLPVYTHDAGNSDITGFWTNLYNGINKANALLENVGKPDMPEQKRGVIKGEALFLRGYFYFLLVQHFGDVPLKLSSTTGPKSEQYSLPRAPARDVYNQIIADMTAADSLVNDITAYGYSERVSKSAVEGILARVCLQMAGEPVKDESKYAAAKFWANKVITSGVHHALNPDYKQVFINESQNLYDIKENIWEAGFYGNETSASGGDIRTSGYVGIVVGIQCVNLDSGYNYGTIYAHGLLYKSFDARDLRRDWVIGDYTYSSAMVRVPVAANQYYTRFPGKWRREYELLKPRAKNACGTNFPLLRYADVLLMYAEAENKLNGPAGALDAINQVRRRAYGKTLNGESVKAVTITNGGSGYTTAPVVTISGGSPVVNATATATVSGGKVTAITITNAGTFYKTSPAVTVVISPPQTGTPATATATISTPADADLPSDINQENFQIAVQIERFKELAYECLRNMDLVRWGKLIENTQAAAADLNTYAGSGLKYGVAAGNNITARNVLWPIPTSEISINKKLTQNPGY